MKEYMIYDADGFLTGMNNAKKLVHIKEGLFLNISNNNYQLISVKPELIKKFKPVGKIRNQEFNDRINMYFDISNQKKSSEKLLDELIKEQRKIEVAINHTKSTIDVKNQQKREILENLNQLSIEEQKDYKTKFDLSNETMNLNVYSNLRFLEEARIIEIKGNHVEILFAPVELLPKNAKEFVSALDFSKEIKILQGILTRDDLTFKKYLKIAKGIGDLSPKMVYSDDYLILRDLTKATYLNTDESNSKKKTKYNQKQNKEYMNPIDFVFDLLPKEIKNANQKEIKAFKNAFDSIFKNE